MLTPWEKSYDQPRQQIKKQRYYFANKGPSSQGYVVMYGCESWTMKKVERRRIDAFELMLLNCGAGEDSCMSLVLQGDPTSPS